VDGIGALNLRFAPLVDPFLMAIDESFDIGSDTRTGVDDSYKLPFRFNGTINKLTFKLGKEQLSAEDREVMKKALASAHD
jgi:hypothetical protein